MSSTNNNNPNTNDNNVSPIPKEFESITPHLIVKNAAAAIEFYKNVFSATEEYRHSIPGNENKIVHAVLNIGKSKIMLADEFPEMCNGNMPQGKLGSPDTIGGNSVFLSIYVEDVDSFFNKAQNKGAFIVMPVMDAFWGDRYGQIRDPFGHIWEVATHKKDMSKEEMEKAAIEFFGQMSNNKSSPSS